MSTKKVIPLGKESQNDEEFTESLQFIQTGLDSLEEGVEFETPNIQWFEQMVADQKEELQKKLIKDVSIFVCIALIIVSVVLFTLYQLPVIFFALQGIATLFVIFYSARGHFKQVDEA
jgi:hypothetical protein